MFVLAELKDTVRIPPWDFKRKLNDAITDELNRKLSNKVYLNVGLCIALHDITKIEESYIFPGDGASHTKVVFRFIVFRPFMEEVLIGKIRSCSVDGVHVTLGFFEDIVIPPHKLQHPSRFDQMEQVWVWEYDTGDGEKHNLFMDTGILKYRVDLKWTPMSNKYNSLFTNIIERSALAIVFDDSIWGNNKEKTLGEIIRFRVVSENFSEALPTGPNVTGEAAEKPDAKISTPYTLGAAIDEPGLGLLTWWENA